MAATIQQGDYTIPTGVQTVTISFPVSFGVAPVAVIPVLVNNGPTTLSGQTKQRLALLLEGWTATNFTVSLSAVTNRIDYHIVWVAGDLSASFSGPAQSKRVGQLKRRTLPPKDTDLLLLVNSDGNPTTETLPVGSFLTNLVELTPAPASSASPGVSRKIAIDDTFIHTYANGAWGKLRRDGVTVIQDRPWRVVKVATTAVAFDRLVVDTTLQAITVILPLSPAVGTFVDLVDLTGSWALRPLTISGNGLQVAGSSTAVVSAALAAVAVYVGVTEGWRLSLTSSTAGTVLGLGLYGATSSANARLLLELNQVNNTADLAKPVSSAQATAISGAISTAAADATSKANSAQSTAISTAAADATSKSNSAISTASADATSKSNSAISTAAADATSKSNSAISTAAADATSKSNAVLNSTALPHIANITSLTGGISTSLDNQTAGVLPYVEGRLIGLPLLDGLKWAVLTNGTQATDSVVYVRPLNFNVTTFPYVFKLIG